MKMILGLLALGLTTIAQAKKEELPEITVDGLHRVHDSKLAIVYAEPGAELSGYHRVMMLEPYIAFKKNWARDQRTQSSSSLRIRNSDIEKIKKNLATEFSEVFRTTLTEGGYPIVEEAGEDVLLIRPAIINLDVNAPDTPSAGFSRTYTQSAGEMTLYIELYDSITGELIAKAMDQKSDNGRGGFYTWTNSVTNRQAAQRILKGWSTILLEALDDARTETGEEASKE